MGKSRISVFIAGAQKAATTALLRDLDGHPGVRSQYPKREFPFFVEEPLFAKGYDAVFDEFFGADPVADGQILLAKNVGVTDSKKTMMRLHEHNPDVKVILVMRDPIKRAYSGFQFSQQEGREPLEDFLEALRLEEERLEKDFEKWKHCGYVFRSRYSDQIEEWYEVFPKSQVKLVFFEDYVADRDETLKGVVEFCGLEPYQFEDPKKRENKTTAVRSRLIAQVMDRAVKCVRNDTIRKLTRPLYPLLKKLNTGASQKRPMTPEELEFLEEKLGNEKSRVEAVTGLRAERWKS